jgi:cytochrome P450
VDFIEQFSSPLCAGVMGDLLGLGPALQPRFKRWADDLTSITGTAPEDLARQGEIRDTVAEFDQYSTEVLAQRRQEPCEDFVTDLLRVQVDGVPLTEPELHSFLFVVLVSGLEPGVHLVNHAALLLAREPEVQARLRRDRSLVFPFIEEVMRYETSVHAIPRHTTADTELGGVRLPKGSRLWVVLASASRDEARFPDGERFNLQRGGLQDMSFGAGDHFCLGANLARLQARLTVEALLGRYARISLGPEPLVWNRSMTVRGPVTLPLRFDLA